MDIRYALTGNVDLVVNLPLEESKNKQHVLKNKLQLKTKTKYYFSIVFRGFLGGFFLAIVTAIGASQGPLPPEMRSQMYVVY
ncbi:hypothetical protein JCM21531_280 [Acetivibrio straminisolvens JCM 21531]|uniref:Uncharacterized protein n=2 Tax=Acetivibrio straminisolvens TaxID=253314 RepID=W4V2K8_9FIRM|nr:hypothetical protein JCM21531_280 [Acetivibrio straminisolvens JCM 21531]